MLASYQYLLIVLNSNICLVVTDAIYSYWMQHSDLDNDGNDLIALQFTYAKIDSNFI